MTYTTWTLSLPVYLHSIISSLLSCVSLLNTAEILAGQKAADTRQNVLCSVFKVRHLVTFRTKESVLRTDCPQICHCPPAMKQKFSLQKKDILSCSSTPTPSLPWHSDSRLLRLFPSKAQRTFRSNLSLPSVLRHFKLIKTLKTRMILTQSTVQICRLTVFQNYVSWSYTEIAD